MRRAAGRGLVLGALAGFLAAAPLLAVSRVALERAVPRLLAPEEIAALPRDGSQVFLQPIVFDPTAAAPDFTSVGLPALAAGEYGLVQFAPGALAEKERLEVAGVRFFGYIPDNAFQVKLTAEAQQLLSKSPGVRWFGPYAPGFKVHPRLWAVSRDSRPEVTVVLFGDASLDAVASEVSGRFPDAVLTFRFEDERWPRLRFVVPDSVRAAFVAAAAALDGTAWLEPYSPPRLLNNDALGPVQSNVLTALSGGACTSCTIFNHGITGTGQIAAIADSGLDSDMCFFRYSSAASDVTDAETTLPPAVGTLFPGKKVIGYWVQPGATAYDNNATCGSKGSPNNFHGTHTSGTVAGDNDATRSTASNPGIDTGDGMAPNAQILFQDVGDDTTGCLSGLGGPDMFLQALSGGARVHSNSYGDGSADGAYSSEARDVDQFLFDHEQMAIFFSAGNEGSAPTTTGSPANAKNAIAVGALGHGNATTTASFSSRGPTADGRVKPDIMAPGISTISASGDVSHTDANCAVQGLSGTSMSCPTVAGAAALLREYFVQGFYPTGAATASNAFEPPASLVKAVLLNGTLPLGTFGDGNFGWGRVFLDNNLFFTGDARSLRVWNLANTEGLTTGQSNTYTVTAAAGQEFRATLVWFDPEATPGTAITLVNNLNLTVSDGTNTYLGNVLNPAGASVTGGTADARNTVEQVRLTTPGVGTYTITVTAAAVPGNGRAYTNRQGYALVVSAAGCATAVASAPTSLSAVSHPVMGSNLTFTPAPGSHGTQVYRAPGNCSAGVQSFQFVGTAAGATFTDTRAEGGETYAYLVRGVDNCGEGPASACVTLTPSGLCDLLPSFSGLASASAAGTFCRIQLTWTVGASHCPTGPAVNYNVYRSSASDFAPSTATLLATVAGLSYNDDTAASGSTYYYVVRAEDTGSGGSGPHGGHEEANVAKLFATPLGAPGAFGTWTDNGGDTSAQLRAELPWQVSTRQAQAGARSYHCGPEQGNYAPNLCAALTTPDLTLGTGSALTYWARYNCEYQWDGVVVEISSDGGATWVNLPPDAGYGTGNTLALTEGNGCNYPATQGAFTGPTANDALTPWTTYQSALSPAYDGKTVRIRWRFTSDPGAEFEGFYVDTISVTSVRLPGACTAVVASAPKAPVVPAGHRSHSTRVVPPRTP
ncbi:MAG TPA: S8 family serine peptidase [Thermoanaerobaculia bacterium]|nr:S8 family serine peptidase [Thermoanaerobaculia bacterium]